MEKTLGQIAHEAHQVSSFWKCPWEDLTDGSKAAFDVVALAVAAAVKEEDARICDSILEPNFRAFSAAIRASIKEVK